MDTKNWKKGVNPHLNDPAVLEEWSVLPFPYELKILSIKVSETFLLVCLQLDLFRISSAFQGLLVLLWCSLCQYKVPGVVTSDEMAEGGSVSCGEVGVGKNRAGREKFGLGGCGGGLGGDGTCWILSPLLATSCSPQTCTSSRAATGLRRSIVEWEAYRGVRGFKSSPNLPALDSIHYFAAQLDQWGGGGGRVWLDCLTDYFAAIISRWESSR